ncbi:MAG: Tyrosine-tRNA ligase [Candidatus Nomurabacteria bacterium GW2011_GWB1_37_5]|uniref:Tyrosine--tRNA ligase n=1 Tax=Candidatus Nomurabacteria bacterium GW2011_GWB1_37_5 TaxID=1618742 RepID=A0A0G0K5G1_9BACT|nr:MAG: Tyrosine-tRNA ligase [Candidatus Nomurabacteria bacterium GW2011_GWB1_37_5]
MTINRDPKVIEEILTRGVEEIIKKEDLEKNLLSGRVLRIKFGIDPTAPDLHIGHTVPLRKLRQFQEAGHQTVLIIGDFTAKIGDPSGRSETRKTLTDKEIKINLKKYLDQAGKILDLKKTEVRYNSEWFKNEPASKLFDIAGSGTFQQMMHRADFKKRIKNNQDITVAEMIYPLLQGYDSVMVKADVEIGGTDQKFNLLMGRQVQRKHNQNEQNILMTPILEGLDGVKKMSKSYGNYIALDDEPKVMLGKIMTLPDNLINKYFNLCTNMSSEEILDYEKRFKSGENPRDLKLILALEIVKIYHGEKKAKEAEDYFIKTFQKKEIPEEIEVLKIKKGGKLIDFLTDKKILPSKSEFRRLVQEKGLHNLSTNETIEDPYYAPQNDFVLKIGKKKFYRIKIK